MAPNRTSCCCLARRSSPSRCKCYEMFNIIVVVALLMGCCESRVPGGRLTESAHAWATYKTVPAAAVQNRPGATGSLAELLHIQLRKETLAEYGPSFQDLSVLVTPETPTRLHVKISPTGQQRWEVPESIIPRPGPMTGLKTGDLTYTWSLRGSKQQTQQQEQHQQLPQQRVPQQQQQQQQGGDEPYALTVTRLASGAPIFNTTGHRFLFKDQYIELTTAVPKDADLYGLGEVTLPTGLLLPRDGTVITLWNRDLSASQPYANLYGSHAFYLQVNRDGFAHGVYFLNSNGMDVTLNQTTLTYRVIGGLVDLYFFTGPTPEEVIRQYHQVIGTTAMPPFWALGAHQGKWGYSNIDVLEDVAANYTAAGVPLECIWVDIEHMRSRFQTMTFDKRRFPAHRMKAFADKLHTAGRHWVPIQDAGIAVANGYPAYEEGTKDNVWIKDHTGDTYLGQVWPGETVYPDYLSNPNTTKWLTKQLRRFYQQAPFDGVWLDMSEASNFCSGMKCVPPKDNKAAMHWLETDTPQDYNLSALIQPRTTCQLECAEAPTSNTLAHPPYKIHNYEPDSRTRGASISTKVIHPTARHADGTLEYNAHNLFGTAMAKSHYQAFTAITGKRPFMILRSTFPGAGRWTGHWTGDNRANWQGFYESIASTINPSFWGMAMVGPDVCGFIDTARGTPEQQGFTGMVATALSDHEYEELCNRWTAAGAWYPFVRNHMGYFARDHEPYQWPAVAAAARKAYGMRYQLLTHLYGELFLAHSQGGALARPLLFADPSDLYARNATRQWMMGEALLISPVMAYNTTDIKPHFTAGNWYSVWDYKRISVTKGQAVPLTVPLGDIALHFRGGAIIPRQHYANVTRALRHTPVTLIVTLPEATVRAQQQRRQGPLAPYVKEPVCAEARQRHMDDLVSCGLLYQDSDTIEVSKDNTVQVWYTAATSANATSGLISSMTVSNAGNAAGKIHIQAVHILGVAPTAAKSSTVNPTATVNGQRVRTEYDVVVGVLKLSGIKVLVGRPFAAHWSV